MPLGLDVSPDPLPDLLGPGLCCHFREMGETCISQILLADRVSVALSSPHGIGIGHLIALHSPMGWGPPDCDGAPSPDQDPLKVDYGPCQRLTGPGLVCAESVNCCRGVGEFCVILL